MNGTRPQRTFLGHPIGLYVLFFTEMWDAFSYYGMRALLMLYMVNYLKWTQKDASTHYKVYTSFVYVTPILGGFLADRYLGNRLAVIIGAVLMAIGHFLMAFEQYEIFLSALIFLMIGNGFFKPNMSTQVGRLYPTNDGRRDGAYTIFYMGINLGGFLSPLACGWLADNTVGGYHTGFTMAGIGMVFGLVIYLLGQPYIQEIASTEVAGTNFPAGAANASQESRTMTEEEAAPTPSILGRLSNLFPPALMGLGVLVIATAPVLWALKRLDIWDAIMVGIAGVCFFLIGFVAAKVIGGVRDRVLAILTLGVFVVFFWTAFEQAGNTLNIWADKHTDRYLTEAYRAQSVIPTVIEDEPGVRAAEKSLLDRFGSMFHLKERADTGVKQSWSDWFREFINPISTTSFQAINSAAIVIFAPFFAWLWLFLDRRKLQPSIPIKMFLGLMFMSMSVAVMIGAANRENQLSQVKLRGGSLPSSIALGADNQLGVKKDGKFEPFQAGRLTFDESSRTLRLLGVLPDNQRDRIIEQTAPEDFKKKVEKLAEDSKAISAKKVKRVEVVLDQIPPGFDMKFAGIKSSTLEYVPAERKLIAYDELREKEIRGLLVAAGDPNFRVTIQQLFTESCNFTVSSWWLMWNYIFATFGELCLSPVGLSMVSKLAPARFATMLMGVWLLTNAFGNFAAGALGEIWEIMTPYQYFLQTTVIVGVAAVVLFIVSRLVEKTMHGVK